MKLLLLPVLIFFQTAALAQFSDDFSDGDHCREPVWFGDTAHFKIDAALRLQLQAPAVAGHSSLFIPSGMSWGKWEFSISFGFNPSSSNLARIYLMSSSSDVASSNGYYISVGGTADDICLYKQKGTSVTKVIDGPDKVLNQDSNYFHIRAERDPEGNWSLMAGVTPENLVKYGEARDAEHNIAVFFGIQCIYTSTRSEKFWFDHILAEAGIEHVSPRVTSCMTDGLAAVHLRFSEPIDESSCSVPGNYSLSGDSPSFIACLGDSVGLEFSPREENQAYELHVRHITDTAGNPIRDTTLYVSFYSGFDASHGNIVLTEIMADPSPPEDLPESEYLEIWNASPAGIDLSSLRLCNNGKYADLAEYYLPAGEYLILCAAKDSAALSSHGPTLGVQGWTTLLNNSGKISINNAAGDVIDSISYVLSQWATNKKDGGWSLEKIHPTHPCGGQQNWMTSADPRGGTPGTENSVYDRSEEDEPLILMVTPGNDTTLLLSSSSPLDPASLNDAMFILSSGATPNATARIADTCFSLSFDNPFPAGRDTLQIRNVVNCFGKKAHAEYYPLWFPAHARMGDVIINEVLADPSPQVELPDAEFIELYNASPHLLSLKGWKLSIDGQKTTLPAFELKPAAYAILCAEDNREMYSRYGEVHCPSTWRQLVNSQGEVALWDHNDSLIHIIRYSLSSYQSQDKNNGGWSLECINPLASCIGERNMAASHDNAGGTPGNENSNFSADAYMSGPQLLSASSGSGTIHFNFDRGIWAEGSSLLHFPDTALPYSVEQPVQNELVVRFNEGFMPRPEIRFGLHGLRDCLDKDWAADTIFSFLAARTPMAGDLLFTELFVRPQPEAILPAVEYAELYNRSTDPLSLSGCTFNAFLLPDIIIMPQQSVAIVAMDNLEAFSKKVPLCKVIGIEGLGISYFSNTSMSIELKSPTADEICSLFYDERWFEGEDNSPRSLELMSYDLPCPNHPLYWSWSLSPAGGTPGTINSLSLLAVPKPPLDQPKVYIKDEQVRLEFNQPVVLDSSWTSSLEDFRLNANGSSIIFKNAGRLVFPVVLEHQSVRACNYMAETPIELKIDSPSSPMQLVINEVHYDPADGEADFIEVHNPSYNFLTLEGARIATYPQGLGTSLDSCGLLLPPGGYAVFSSSPLSITRQFPHAKQNSLFHVKKFPNLPGKKGWLKLTTAEGALIDELAYDDQMHTSFLNKTEGIALERLSPHLPASMRENWTSAASSAGFATPGYQNSHTAGTGNTQHISLSSTMISPDNNGVNDLLTITIKGGPGRTGKLTIADLEGMRLHELMKPCTLGEEMIVIWGGEGPGGRLLPTGIYLLVAEVLDENGILLREKIVLTIDW